MQLKVFENELLLFWGNSKYILCRMCLLASRFFGGRLVYNLMQLMKPNNPKIRKQ
jgi:hypothetical protein